jgi:hypothetical protein
MRHRDRLISYAIAAAATTAAGLLIKSMVKAVSAPEDGEDVERASRFPRTAPVPRGRGNG